jgi:hypothetical protein
MVGNRPKRRDTPSTHTRGFTMRNENNTNKERQPGKRAQPDNSVNKRPYDQQEKSSKAYDTKSDRPDQEKAGKGKIATSVPGDEKFEPNRF